MIIHENTLVSEDLFEKKFICDLNACKGACCVEGDFGAPITKQDEAILLENLPVLNNYLTPEALTVIAEKGVSELDKDGDLVTTCLPSGECVFSSYQNGILSCAIEQAWREGKVSYQKPLSCHLYPIRVNVVGDYDALNYHKWDVCKPACQLGEKHQMPVYKFLQGPLERAYGKEWFSELNAIANAYNNQD